MSSARKTGSGSHADWAFFPGGEPQGGPWGQTCFQEGERLAGRWLGTMGGLNRVGRCGWPQTPCQSPGFPSRGLPWPSSSASRLSCSLSPTPSLPHSSHLPLSRGTLFLRKWSLILPPHLQGADAELGCRQHPRAWNRLGTWVVLGISALEERGPESRCLPLGLSFPDVKLMGWGRQASNVGLTASQVPLPLMGGYRVAALGGGGPATLQGAGDLLLSRNSCWDTWVSTWVDYSVLSSELGPHPCDGGDSVGTGLSPPSSSLVKTVGETW